MPAEHHPLVDISGCLLFAGTITLAIALVERAMGVAWFNVSPLPDRELLLFGLALGAGCALLFAERRRACCAPAAADGDLKKTRIE